MTIFGIAKNVWRLLNFKSKIILNSPLSTDIALRIPSVEKPQKILKFKSKVDFYKGIARTAGWTHFSILDFQPKKGGIPRLIGTGVAIRF